MYDKHIKVVFFVTDLYCIILGQSGEYLAQNGNLRKKRVASVQIVYA